MTAMLLIDGIRHTLWRNQRPPAVGILALVALATPVAYFIGTLLAIQFLRLPKQAVYAHQMDHATGLFIFMILIAVAVSWFYWSRAELMALKAQAEADKARAAAIEKQAMQAQLQLLQAQIEPHMLFNTLANLQGLIAYDAPRAQHMLDQLIQYLRATLSSSRSDKSTLKQEFALMGAYLELMSIRMGARLTYSLQLPPALERAEVPPMLLQPLLENAIKHGLEAKIDGGHIDVRAERQGDMLLLTVADTGLGLEATADPYYPNHGTKLGLENVRERLAALYGEHADFSLLPNTPCGAIACLTLPITLEP
jgi:sensor histidine kinase YesM